jgi:PEP-CTERM motif/Trypsin
VERKYFPAKTGRFENSTWNRVMNLKYDVRSLQRKSAAHIALSLFAIVATQGVNAAPFSLDQSAVVPFESAGFASTTGAIKFDVELAQPEARLVASTTSITELNGRFVSPSTLNTGVGGLLIRYANGSGSTCTGTLVSASVVLTAAHCINPTTRGSAVASLSFFLPGFRNALYNGGVAPPGADPDPIMLMGTHYAINPNFIPTAAAGGTLGGSDLALVYLSSNAPTNRQINGIYRGNDEIDEVHNKVGLGTRGFGRTGTMNLARDGFDSFDGRKREGNNIYEYTFKDIFGQDLDTDLNGNQRADADSVLLFDFDSGLRLNDVFGRLGEIDPNFGKPQTGVVVNGLATEVNSSPGDSGGPTFINGLVAGITSFGFSGNFLYGQTGCGGVGNIDTARGVGAGASCTNSSFGEVSGDTRVSYFANWIDAGIAGRVSRVQVPVPATLLLLALGVAAIGFLKRRRV